MGNKVPVKRITAIGKMLEKRLARIGSSKSLKLCERVMKLFLNCEERENQEPVVDDNDSLVGAINWVRRYSQKALKRLRSTARRIFSSKLQNQRDAQRWCSVWLGPKSRVLDLASGLEKDSIKVASRRQ